MKSFFYTLNYYGIVGLVNCIYLEYLAVGEVSYL